MAESAYDIQRELLQRFGLPDAQDVIDVINNGILNGDSDSIIELNLQTTPSWKQRFAGNEKRRAAGLNVLSVDEYLSQEKQYSDLLHNAGLPSGFYDDPSDFADFIGNSVSPSELNDRVNLAADIVAREDPSVMDQLTARGITAGQLIAHALDPLRAAPLIKREQNSILVGAAASRTGLNLNQSVADSLAERGVGEAQAVQGFGQINDFFKDTDKLGDIYGVDYGLNDAVDEVFNGGSSDKRKRLGNAERSAFSGQNAYGVVQRNTAGGF